MGVTTFTSEYVSPIAPARLFKAATIDAQNIMPKVMPQQIKNIDSANGNICKTVFAQGSPLKKKIDNFDSQNLTFKYTITEGELLGDMLESISCLVKFEPSGNGGCVVKTTSECRTKGDFKLRDQDIKAGKENASAFSKAVEDYLLKNPTVCAC